jgi:transcriptional regulator with XRE-family HTH domain
MDETVPQARGALHDAVTPSPILAALGLRLREAREAIGLSQTEAAQLANCALRSLCRWEKGECDPGIETVLLLAKFYQVSIDWLTSRTPIKKLLEPGTVLIDEELVRLLEGLEKNATALRLPEEAIRHPGIDIGWRVPNEAAVVSAEEAREIDERLHRSIKKYVRRKR